MLHQDSAGTRWNFFARELENTLNEQNHSINQLVAAGIHPGKVRRIIQSLHAPKTFPILTYEELASVEYWFRLNEEDMLRLRAALLATSMQKTLTQRMSHYDALSATEKIFPQIVQGLRKQAQVYRSEDGIRGGDSEPLTDDELETFFTTIWHYIDDAEMALQFSRDTHVRSEGIERARVAQRYFERATTALHTANSSTRTLELWQDCDAISQQGIANVEQRLWELGV